MTAEVTTALEAGTDRPCQIGRLVYELGAHRYVALTFRYIDVPMPSTWLLTWVGLEGDKAVRLPEGVRPNNEMLHELAQVTE